MTHQKTKFIKVVLFPGPGSTLKDSDLEHFKKQASCLGFSGEPDFHYNPKNSESALQSRETAQPGCETKFISSFLCLRRFLPGRWRRHVAGHNKVQSNWSKLKLLFQMETALPAVLIVHVNSTLSKADNSFSRNGRYLANWSHIRRVTSKLIAVNWLGYE